MKADAKRFVAWNVLVVVVTILVVSSCLWSGMR